LLSITTLPGWLLCQPPHVDTVLTASLVIPLHVAPFTTHVGSQTSASAYL
jgi:hypothetical protein